MINTRSIGTATNAAPHEASLAPGESAGEDTPTRLPCTGSAIQSSPECFT